MPQHTLLNKLMIPTAGWPAVLRLALIMFMLIAASGQAQAAAGPWQGSDVFSARLITATDAVGTADTLTAGLEVKLKEGWKIYWRSPGDAGLPPELDFSQSSAISGHHLDFPAPYRFTVLGFESYGYKDHVIFPLTLNLADPGRGFTAIASFTGLVCDDVCIPVDETLTLSLPSGMAAASDEARGIAQAAAMVPRQSTSGGVIIDAITVSGDALHISFSRDGLPILPRQGDIFIEGPFDDGIKGYSFAKPAFSDNHAALTISGADPQALAGRDLMVTVVAKDWLLEAKAPVSNANITSATASNNGLQAGDAGMLAGFMLILAIAFLGGVILNVMPCVLPVISLKLAQIVGMGGQDLTHIRRSFLATAAGVVASFVLLGITLLILRQAGVAIGWGIQFQNLYFLGFAAAAIIIFGLIMLDLITIPVPQRMASIGRGQGGLVGDFLTGFMATLLATPCSAPFVGTALTFALTAPAILLVLVFLAMGVGLASPWIMVSIWPGLAARMPRPGPWLITLKRVLSIGLFGTALWLISIMVTVTRDTAVLEGRWQSWSDARVDAALADGQLVFVDVTAAWCLTCKANKALVLDTDAMATVFDDSNVLLLRADWTKPDDAIAAYLSRYDRFGIPFNVVYGPSSPDGITLPELLSVEAVTSALQTAQ